MQEKVQSALNKAADKWRSFNRGQQIRIIAIAVMVVIALGITIFLMMRPRKMLLINNQDATTVVEAQNVLTAQGIRSNIVNNGSALEINEQDYPRAYYNLETNYVTKGKGFNYTDMLDASTMGTTESTKKQMETWTRQDRLEKTLMQFDDVESATITLVASDDANFFLPNNKASASVLVKTRGNRTIPPSVGQGMAEIVKTAVKNLAMEDISIKDTNGNSIYSGSDAISTTGAITTQYEAQELFNKTIEKQIKEAIEPQFDVIRVVTNLHFNWDKIKEVSTTYENTLGDESPSGLINQESTSKQNYTGGATANEPGIAANDQATATYETGGQDNSSASITERTANYLYDAITQEKEYEYGNILKDDSGISVFVYNNVVYNEVEMEASGELANTTWAAFKSNTPDSTALPVDDAVVEALRVGTGIRNLTVIGRNLNSFEDKIVEPINIQQIVVLIIVGVLIVLLAVGLIRKTQPDEVTEVEPELSVEDLLVSTQLAEESDAESDAEKLMEIELGGDSEIKRQIEKFVNEKPEAVAQLLRTWLNEDWE